jgi:hypothetical protein
VTSAHHIVLETVVGSTVHGTSIADGLEDLDIMAVALESAPQVVGFSPKDCWVTRTKPEGVRSEAGDVDHVCYGLRKFLALALKGNPTVLLPFFVPSHHVRAMDDVGEQLRALAPLIVSKKAYAPFRGYMRQQHARLMGTAGQKNCTRPELIERYGFDTKYAAHVVRLGLQGAELLSTGRLSLPMRDEERSLVVSVRTGKFSLPAVSQLITEAEERLDAAFAASTLRDEPDYAAVEAWMIGTYLGHWRKQ